MSINGYSLKEIRFYTPDMVNQFSQQQLNVQTSESTYQQLQDACKAAEKPSDELLRATQQAEETYLHHQKILESLHTYKTGPSLEYGSEGTVCKVRRKFDKRVYALKILNKEWSPQKNLKEECFLVWLNQEQNKEGKAFFVELIAGLSFLNPTTKKFHRGLLMPLYQRDMLSQHSDNDLSYEEGLGFSRFLMETLSFLKKHQVVHLDIKPENIFLKEDGTYVLGDFGFAVMARDLPKKNMSGTPEYLCPSGFIDPRTCGYASDMWSAAVTVCTAVAGTRPFGHVPPGEVVSEADKKLPKSLRNVFLNQQKVLKKSYSEYLQQIAKERGLEEILCPEEEFTQGPSLEDFMKDRCLGLEEKEGSGLWLALLRRMLDFNHETRITPEEALAALDQILPVSEGGS